MSEQPDRLILQRLPTPIGEALIVVDEEGVLRAFDWEDYAPRMMRLLGRHYGDVTLAEARAPEAVTGRIAAYFAGELGALSGLAWRTGGTAFQRTVWRTLCEIPLGQAWSYKALAGRVGTPAAVRAVGMANGANPVGVVVPCHRVIGAGGALSGYAGGLARKAWLLAHEGAPFRAERAA
jgi:methylated-DNA-[protein]-cysteine S-methyltransferase